MKRIVMGALVLLPWVAVAADITPLGLKPGLWEVTVNTKMQLPEAVLANMPAQARAAMDARAQNIVVKSCLTKESMSRAMDFNNDPKRTCQSTLVSSTATKQVVNVECTTKNGKSSGTMTFEAVTPESGAGSMELTMDSGAGTMKTKMTFSTKFLGADCGDVKPR